MRGWLLIMLYSWAFAGPLEKYEICNKDGFIAHTMSPSIPKASRDCDPSLGDEMFISFPDVCFKACGHRLLRALEKKYNEQKRQEKKKSNNAKYKI